ncbi:putative eukaryotic aspartyl protease family protein [Phaeomoniella chlamydospora]|uniref:Putative eukaryotic aspartyl protease family protein n=1 Tax=Phaeomoniella chlamydospora TaxID=158046 RepID=A0A0G2EQJ0_PHACM|nr:putative eukaryotic aspartyl protease family protein [Phaeomoniella chlamydospora]
MHWMLVNMLAFTFGNSNLRRFYQFALLTLFADICTAKSPSPLSVPVDSSQWLGYDGNWSPVILRAGTPEQWVYVLPNILSSETWVIGPDGCDGTYTCETERGGIFNASESTTWDEIGNYELGFDNALGVTGTADYGDDTLALSDSVVAEDQIVGILTSTQFWTGLMGLGVEESDFTGSAQKTFLSTLVENDSLVPSHSYGYTAGAYYRLKGVPASLTFGGVDTNRYVANDVSFALNANSQPVVAINSIKVTAQSSSETSLRNWTSPLTLQNKSSAAKYTIDSSTPFLWMPGEVCDAFAEALGLYYNETLELYTFEGNSTVPSLLENWNLTFTFDIADTPRSSNSVELTLPYDAFNLELTYPFPNLWANYTSPATKYFPLRRATDSTQYTIGRMFLQETYLTVDYERGNFSLSQAVFSYSAQTDINLAEITRPSNSSYDGPKESNSGLSTGAKAGIGVAVAVGVLLFLCLIALLVLLRRQKKANAGSEKSTSEHRRGFLQLLSLNGSRSVQNVQQIAPTELPASKQQPTEVPADVSASRFELPGSTPIEMEGSLVPLSYYAKEDHRSNPPVELPSNRRFSMSKSPSGSSGRTCQEDSHDLPRYTPMADNDRHADSISPDSPTRSGNYPTYSSSGPISPNTIHPDPDTGSGGNSFSPVSPDTSTGSNSNTHTNSLAATIIRAASYSSPNNNSNTHLSVPGATEQGSVARSQSTRSSRFREEGIDLNPLVNAQEELRRHEDELGSDSGYRIRDPVGDGAQRKLSRISRMIRPRSRADGEGGGEQRRRFSWEQE